MTNPDSMVEVSWDGRVWRPGLTREEWEIVKLMVAEWDPDQFPADDPRRTEGRHKLLADLQAEGFERAMAMRLVVAAKAELRSEVAR